jgi:hypothetical protein
MQYLTFCLFFMWTVFFGFIFYTLVPDVTKRLKLEVTQSIKGEEGLGLLSEQLTISEYSENARIRNTNQPKPSSTQKSLGCPKPEPQETTTTTTINENDLVPIDKNNPPIQIEIQQEGESELPEYQDEINQEIENRLIKILEKINVASCKECGKDDKKVILQLKMMKALLDENPDLAQKYSKELDKYLKSKKIPPKIEKREDFLEEARGLDR